MPYSVITDGKVEDISYKPFLYGYHVYLGTQWIGTVSKMRVSWTAVGISPNPFNLVDGFATRTDAMRHLLQLRRYEQCMQDFKRQR